MRLNIIFIDLWVTVGRITRAFKELIFTFKIYHSWNKTSAVADRILVILYRETHNGWRVLFSLKHRYQLVITFEVLLLWWSNFSLCEMITKSWSRTFCMGKWWHQLVAECRPIILYPSENRTLICEVRQFFSIHPCFSSKYYRRCHYAAFNWKNARNNLTISKYKTFFSCFKSLTNEC